MQLGRERVQQIKEEKSAMAMLIAQQKLQTEKDAQAKAEQLQEIENLTAEKDHFRDYQRYKQYKHSYSVIKEILNLIF